MNTYLGNAFSLQMLDTAVSTDIRVTPVDASVVASSDFTSVSLTKGDTLFVAQVIGGRLPAGATTLPDGFRLAFLKVTII